MPDFKFAKGFFTGMLVTDVVVATGLLCLTWYIFKPRKDYNRPLSRYGQYPRDRYGRIKHSKGINDFDKKFL